MEAQCFAPADANAVELKHLMAGKLFKALPAQCLPQHRQRMTVPRHERDSVKFKNTHVLHRSRQCFSN
jgi:hypothetical protein